ncbi:MAG: CoA transferase [Tepidiformaceae bacterium]
MARRKPLPLRGLRVVELSTGLEVAFCAKELSAWGADVALLEPPAGHQLRRSAPVVAGAGRESVSLTWEYVAAGKRSASFDARRRGSAARLGAALDGADVLVTDWAPESLANLGVDLGQVSERWPGLVVAHISPFGLDGPYARFEGTDLVVQALSGYLGYNGDADREPLKAPANILRYAVGVAAQVGVLAALQERRTSGLGQVVEVAAMEALAMIVPLLRTEYSGQPAQRVGGPFGGTTMFECADGWLSTLPHPPRLWEMLLTGLELTAGDVPADLQTQEGRQDLARTRAFIGGHMKKFTADELFHRLSQLRLVCGALRTPHELLSNEQLAVRGLFEDMDHPLLGAVRRPGRPARTSLSGHRDAAPAQPVGHSRIRWPERVVVAHGKDRGGALEGLRVIDLTHAWIGTFATQLLADLGADVVKVESIRHPDVWRGVDLIDPKLTGARAGAHRWNLSSLFNSVNCSKRSVALELNTEEGRELFLELVREADVVTENFTPRVMGNFGLGWDVLRAVNPRLVMVSYSGFGATGPWRDYRANGATTETHAGWDSLLGYPGGPPMMMGSMQADAITGLQMAATTLVALEEVARSGRGQWVDGSMFDAAVCYIGEEMMLASLAAEAAERNANRSREMAPHGAFRCAGNDRWVAIAVRDDADWARLVSLEGIPAELTTRRWNTLSGRLAAESEIEAALARWTSEYTAEDLMRRLQAVRVPAGVVQWTDEVLADPHLEARGWFQPLDHPDLGVRKYDGFPWRLWRTPAAATSGPPILGQHSREILVGELGIGEVRFGELRDAGVTGTVTGYEKQPEPAAVS